MKKSIIFAATLLLLLTMVSCNQDSLTPSDTPLTWDGGTRAENNPLDEIDFSALDTAYFVSDKDVEAYIHFKELLAKGQGKEFAVQEVIPMGLNDEATLAYLLNYNEGWEIIAADKRAPVVLGADLNGTFPSKDIPTEIKVWIEKLECEVLFLRTFSSRPKVADDDTWNEMLGSINFWKAINIDSDYIESYFVMTRVAPDLSIGHWEFVETRLFTTTYEIVSPLLYNVNFHQGESYNQCCPSVAPLNQGRAFAGCVAIAGAQMAYYLHSYFQRPATAPSTGYCDGNAILQINSDYSYVLDTTAYHTIHTGNSNSYIWASMLNNSSSASYLIAEIGKRVQMHYGPVESTTTRTDLLVTEYFNDYDVSCSYSVYNADSVKFEVKNNMPVIVIASPSNGGYGHAFIVDGYKRTKNQLVNIYTWVYDETSSGPRPLINDRIEIVTDYPTMESFHLNWGMGANYNGNQSWYGITGAWSIEGVNYTNKTDMIWKFR